MNKRRGFSIVEMVLAGAILLIGVTVTFSILPNIYRLNQKSWNMTKAVFYAQDKLDELTEAATLVDTSPQTDDVNDPNYVPPGLENGVRTWWGQPDPYGNSLIQLVTVRVAWTEGKTNRQIEVQGLVTHQ